MRLFVAVDVAAEVREPVGAVVDDLRTRWRGLRWVAPVRYHLTLAFLGSVEDADVPAVVEVVAGVAAERPPAEFRLGTAGRFGQRVLWVGVDDDPHGWVREAGAATQGALVSAGLPVQEQEVRPHLTLARSGREHVTDEVVAAVQDGLDGLEQPLRWQIDRIGLWRSTTGPAPYEVVEEASLVE